MTALNSCNPQAANALVEKLGKSDQATLVARIGWDLKANKAA